MRNLDKWRLFLKEYPSPDSYIDFSFYGMISSALQRRVWLGAKLAALYPNVYIILTGEPSVGKTLVIKQVGEIMRMHKLDINTELSSNIQKPQTVQPSDITISPEDIVAYNATAVATAPGEVRKTMFEKEKPLLFPIGAESTTYEAMINSIALAKRLGSYRQLQKDGTSKIINETHSSICFLLEEISSLFRKHTEDLVNFLLAAYDCGDYRYETKTQGKDIIKRCCVTLLGGTTPGFMRRVFSDELLTEGFASRTIFVFELANRQQRLLIPDFTEEQMTAREDIAKHVKNLSRVNGQVTYTKDALEFLRHWWEVVNPNKRPNDNIRLSPYYGRKNIHAQKLAMLIHFSDQTESMVIEKSTCEEALAVLEAVEKRMHHAVTLDGRNPLASVAGEIMKYLRRIGPASKQQLLIEFYGNVNEGELMETLGYLRTVKKLKLDDKTMKYVAI